MVPPPTVPCGKGHGHGSGGESAPSDSRSQVQGRPHVVPSPGTAQSRNSEMTPFTHSTQSTCRVPDTPEASVPPVPPRVCQSVPTGKRWCPKIIHRECLQRDHSRGSVWGTPRDSSSGAGGLPGPLGQALGLEGEGLQRATRTRVGGPRSTTASLRRCHSAVTPPHPESGQGTRRWSPHSSDMERPA